VNSGEDLTEALANASGQFVLSASKAGEESLEDESYKLAGGNRAHGAFTYSLLRGLSGAAADTSGVVWLSDLFGHVSREVPRLTEGRQHPYSQSSGTDLPLFVLGEGSQVTVHQTIAPEATSVVLMPAPREKERWRVWGGGESWDPVGVPETFAALTHGGGALAVDPEDPERVYAGPCCSEIFTTSDGGESWETFWSFGAEGIEVDPADPAHVIVVSESAGGGAVCCRRSSGSRSWPLWCRRRV